MGIRLVVAAQTPTWAHLSDRAWRILIIMSTQALDVGTHDHDANHYTGGHSSLARLLFGRDDVTKSDLEMIRRAVKELRDAGAITMTRPPRGTLFPHYRIDTLGIPQTQLPIHNAASTPGQTPTNNTNPNPVDNQLDPYRSLAPDPYRSLAPDPTNCRGQSPTDRWPPIQENITGEQQEEDTGPWSPKNVTTARARKQRKEKK